MSIQDFLAFDTGEILPAIAKSWYVEDDNLTWVFNLRNDATFHNGKNITAYDVKESLKDYCHQRIHLIPGL